MLYVLYCTALNDIFREPAWSVVLTPPQRKTRYLYNIYIFLYNLHANRKTNLSTVLLYTVHTSTFGIQWASARKRV